jgi:hypothetical protein
MHMWHQMQTALVPDDTGKMLYTASSRMVQDESGKLHKEVTVITVVPENKCHHLHVTNPSNIEKSHGSTHQSDMNKIYNVYCVGFPTEFASGQEYDADSSDDDGIVHSSQPILVNIMNTVTMKNSTTVYKVLEKNLTTLCRKKRNLKAPPVKRSKTITQIMYKGMVPMRKSYLSMLNHCTAITQHAIIPPLS